MEYMTVAEPAVNGHAELDDADGFEAPPGRPPKGMGYLRDYASFQDYTPETRHAKPRQGIPRRGPAELLEQTDAAQPRADLPAKVDLRQWCSPVHDQGELGSCTAQAGVGMIEYYERKAFGRHIDASPRFLYKVTRRMAGFKGDSGAFLRNTIGAMALFGVPPERQWRYKIAEFDKEPPAFCYAFASNYQALTYYRLDPLGTDTNEVLARIKTHLASQLPSMFGFTVFSSLWDAFDSGKIPFPTQNENIEGGHAVVAVGYDDKIKIKNPGPGGKTSTGALLIRNSWGKEWGEDGYGWLPYDYVTAGLADDWWVTLKHEWVDTKEFRT